MHLEYGTRALRGSHFVLPLQYGVSEPGRWIGLSQML